MSQRVLALCVFTLTKMAKQFLFAQLNESNHQISEYKFYLEICKVEIFLEGHKSLKNLPLDFFIMYPVLSELGGRFLQILLPP